MKRIIIVLLAAYAAVGCTTITFESKLANTANGTNKVEKWHHNMALSLVEVSEPVNLKQECMGNDWVSVKTETSVLNALAASVPNSVVSGLWDPKTVEIHCEKGK